MCNRFITELVFHTTVPSDATSTLLTNMFLLGMPGDLPNARPFHSFQAEQVRENKSNQPSPIAPGALGATFNLMKFDSVFP